MSEEPTKGRIAGGFLRWVKPSYDEVALLLMSVTSMALFVVDAGLRHQIAGLFSAPERPGPGYFLMWAGVLLGGMALSVFHAFSSRPKTPTEKTWMGAFAMATNGIAGIACGMELFSGQWHWTAIFPLWNILSGVVLLYLMALAPEDAVTDENAALSDILFGLAVLSCLFAYCQYSAHLNWAITFSVCVAYSTSLNQPLRNILRSVKVMNKKDGITTARTLRHVPRRKEA